MGCESFREDKELGNGTELCGDGWLCQTSLSTEYLLNNDDDDDDDDGEK